MPPLKALNNGRCRWSLSPGKNLWWYDCESMSRLVATMIFFRILFQNQLKQMNYYFFPQGYILQHKAKQKAQTANIMS